MKPILFNGDMVRAILEGRKTVTRRIIKPQPTYCTMSKAGLVVSEKPIEISDGIIKAANAEVRKPPFEAGDILYVRETWCKYGKLDENNRLIEGTEQYYYRADGENPTPFNDFLVQHPGWDEHRETPVWHPSIHMPKEAARLFLRVTDVRVEKLLDSFVEQGSTIFCLQDEGVDIGDHCRQCIENYGNPCCNDFDPELEVDEDTGEDANGGSECGVLDEIRTEFSRLWDSTIKPADRAQYGWNANPWVWVIEVERCERKEEGL